MRPLRAKKMSSYDMETTNYTSCKLRRGFSIVQEPVLKESSRGMIHGSERKLCTHVGGNFGGRQKLEKGIILVSQVKIELGKNYK